MEPTSLNDDAEFRLPLEFLTDDDFLVEKEKNLFKGDDSNLFPYELSHGFGLHSPSSGKLTGDQESFLTGLKRKTVRSTHEDDFSGGVCGNHAFPAGKAWGTTRSPLRRDGIGCGHRNQNALTRFSSQAAAWDLYCAAVEELAMVNINDGYDSGRGVLDLPRKHPLAAAAKIPNHGSGYYSHQSFQYQKLQALQFQQLKEQQLMQQRSRGLKANYNKKNAAPVDLSPSAWSNQRRDGSGMRAIFLGGGNERSRSTGTGVFLPGCVNHTSHAAAETREKPNLSTVLVPARVAEVLKLDESLVQQPVIRSSSGSLYGASWIQKSNNGGFPSQMKMEQTVNEPRLPSDWAY